MQERNLIYKKIFFVVSVIGSFFVLAEIIMQSLGKSICFTEGCKIVAQHARYGDISILIIGLLMFSILASLAALSCTYGKPVFERLLNFIIIVSLACEGFFMGYLAFRLDTVCIFCVIVFGFLVTLGILRLLCREFEVLAGFVAFAAVFSLLYLILPVGTTIKIPENDRLILFYSKNCPYCVEVMNEFESEKIIVKHVDVEVNGYSSFLKSMGIQGVPTLLVNEPYQKVFLTGREAIRCYLRALTKGEKPVTKKKQSRAVTAPSKTKNTDLKLDIFTEPNILTRPGGTLSGSGICVEDTVCK